MTGSPSAGVMMTSSAAGPISPAAFARTATLYLVYGFKSVKEKRMFAVLFSNIKPVKEKIKKRAKIKIGLVFLCALHAYMFALSSQFLTCGSKKVEHVGELSCGDVWRAPGHRERTRGHTEYRYVLRRIFWSWNRNICVKH